MGVELNPLPNFSNKKILPAAYDDSLSYYELNAKVLEKTNEVVKQVNANTVIVDSISAQWPTIKSDAEKATADANAGAASANAGAASANAAAQNANNVANTYSATLNELDARVSNIIANGQTTEGNTELIDIRTAYNGAVYTTAGDAVRNQTEELSDRFLKITNSELITPEWVEGYYITAYGVISSNPNFKYSNPIYVEAYETIVVYARGYLANVALLSSTNESGSSYSPIVKSTDSNALWFDYMPLKSGYFSVCTSTELGNIFIVKNKRTRDEGLRFALGVDNPDYSVVAGKYITNTGAIESNTGYSLGGPIALNVGDVLVAKLGIADPQAVAAVSFDNGDGTYKVLAKASKANELERFVLKAEKDGNYYLSWHIIYGKSVEVYVVDSYIIETIAKTEQVQYCDLSLFRKFGVVGDSYASGEIYGSDGAYYGDKYELSWPQIMARKLGTAATNYSSGGLTTRSWLTNSNGLSKMKASDPEDIYYLVLGINDDYQLGTDYLGTIADITGHKSYADYADTFYGNYGKIIEQIQEHAPHALMVMFTCAGTSESRMLFNDAIEEIAAHYGIPCIVQYDDPFFKSNWYKNGMAGGHPRAIVYSGMAAAFERMLKNCIVNNFDYFKNAFAYSN